MELSLDARDLPTLDGLEVDTLLVFHHEAPGPLSGFAGLVDWRLAGRIGRQLADGRITGAYGEKVLLPVLGRLPATRVVGIGIGDPGTLTSERVEELAAIAGATLRDARAEAVATALPGDPEPPGPEAETLARFRDGIARSYGGRLHVVRDPRALGRARR